MGVLSKCSLLLFELINEVVIGMAAGVGGLGVLIRKELYSRELTRTLLATGLCVGGFVYVYQLSIPCYQQNIKNRKAVVLITGCDSGLGYSLALHTRKLGFTLMSTFYNLESEGAIYLKERFGLDLISYQLDLTNPESVEDFSKKILRFFNDNPEHELYAVINNAGVMIFGEFEWLTNDMVENQINVNLLGTLKVTKTCLPLLRKHKGRIINITSHCANACLPGLSTYGATKAGISAFSDGLRVELAKFGVHVIKFIPGSFIMSSKILEQHNSNSTKMFEEFTPEQHLFYDEYFNRYNAHLNAIPVPSKLQQIDNPELYQLFSDALLNKHPKSTYKTEPTRYAVYHFLFSISPCFLRDKLVKKFMMMPEYEVQMAVE